MSGLEQAEPEPADDDPTGDPDYVPNPPYDPPLGQTWNGWIER